MESSSTSSLADQDDDDTSFTPKRVTSSPRAGLNYRQEKRKRRNTAALVQWIGEHPYNPYPTKAEKQNLAFLAGMTTRQLNDWFANARRNIKKMGMENWRKKRNGTLLGSGSNSSSGGTSEGEGGKWHSAYCVCMHEPLHCCLAGAATGRMAYNQAAAGGYGVVPSNYLVANQPMQGAADFRGMFAGPAAATPPGTPALGGLPFHAFNPTHHGPLVFSDSRLPVGSLHQSAQSARHMAPTYFTPTAGYTSGTPPAFQPAPCTYAAQSMHAGAPVIDHTTHTHYPSPWSHLHSMRGRSWVLGESAGNDDTTDQSSPENHGSIKSTSSSSTTASSF